MNNNEQYSIERTKQIQLEQLEMLQEAGLLESTNVEKKKPAKPKVQKVKTNDKVTKIVKKRPVYTKDENKKVKPKKEAKPKKVKEPVVKTVKPKEEKKPVVKVEKPKKVKEAKTPRVRKNLKVNNKVVGAVIILGMIGSGIVLYKSGVPQDLYNQFLAKLTYSKILEESSNNVVETEITSEETSENIEITSEVQTIVEEPEEDIEYISSELFDSGYQFNPAVTPERLKEINPLLSKSTAWLEIPGTNINYPILLPSTDNIDQVAGLREKIEKSDMNEVDYMNNYFLHVDINGTISDWGCPYQSIYTKELNQHTKDISDMSVIYAHHMNDGSMFTGLDKWKKDSDGTYNAEHSFGVLYTDDGMCYKLTFITSGIVNGADGNSIKVGDFATIEDKQQYIDDYIARAKEQGCFTLDGYEVDENTKFITLCTCSYDNLYNNPRNNDRYTLVAVAEREMVKDVHIDGYEIGKEKER